MTTKSAFKAMYKAIGFSDDASTKLNDTEVVDSMPKFSHIKSTRASKICKAIRSPGGGAQGYMSQKGRRKILLLQRMLP